MGGNDRVVMSGIGEPVKCSQILRSIAGKYDMITDIICPSCSRTLINHLVKEGGWVMC